MAVNFSGEEIHLRDYVKVLLKRKWTVVSFFTILVAVVTIGSYAAVPVYRASTQILIERENPNVVNFQEVLAINATSTDYYQTQYKILESRSIVKRVIESLGLDKSEEFSPSHDSSQKNVFLSSLCNYLPWLEESGDTASLNDSNLIDSYLNRLGVNPVKNSRLVEVNFEGKDPELVTKIVNTHAKFYMDQNLERKFAASQEAVEWLGKRLGTLRNKLEESELSLQKYKEKKRIVSLEEKQNIVVQKLAELSSAVTKAKTQRIKLETLYHQLKNLSKKPGMMESLPAVINNPLIQQLKVDYAKLQGEYSEMGKKYGQKHPKMIQLKSQIGTTKDRISLEVEKIAKSIETEYRVAQAEEGTLRNALEEQKKEALELNQKAI